MNVYYRIFLKLSDERKSSNMFIGNGTLIRRGRYSSGDVVYNIDGNFIRAGRYSSGDVIFNID